VRKSSRYDISQLAQNEFEPGSKRQVLRNLLGIKRKKEIDRIEAVALQQVEPVLFRTYDQNHRFSAKDICNIHRIWLGRIYEWAGAYRTVDLTRSSFRFTHARFVSEQMEEFEENVLKQHTPCIFGSKNRMIKALAEVHAELVRIHPFREGNGRVARLLATLMALQAGLPPLNFNIIQGSKKKEYIAAVHAGVGKDYNPMEKIFSWILEKSIPRTRRA